MQALIMFCYKSDITGCLQVSFTGMLLMLLLLLLFRSILRGYGFIEDSKTGHKMNDVCHFVTLLGDRYLVSRNIRGIDEQTNIHR